MIFCLSQLHTGTNSTLEWLASHGDCRGVVLSTGVYSNQTGHRPTTVYHEHVRRDSRFNRQMCRTQMMMAWSHPTIIPLRDPLAALISYQHRAETSGRIETDLFLPREDVVDRWCYLAGDEPSHRIQYLPLDLAEPPTSDRLWEITVALGLSDPAPSAVGLTRENDSGDYYLKRAYRRGDMDPLEHHLIHLDYLRKAEPILRPFLEQRGYRDLMWWR